MEKMRSEQCCRTVEELAGRRDDSSGRRRRMREAQRWLPKRRQQWRMAARVQPPAAPRIACWAFDRKHQQIEQ
jgi:hypothetical protein